MPLCLNPDCRKPQNPDSLTVCQSCGSQLLLKNRYRATRLIGQGGFGRTFLAIDTEATGKTRCVIKQFLPVAQGPRHWKKAAELFEQEALRLKDLGHHPQIPALLAYFRQEDRQYLIQEFIDGKNLAEILSAQGAFSESQVRSLLVSLLPVLEFIHMHQVIHRDIKPANIICKTGRRRDSRKRQPPQPDWAALFQALTLETEQGFRDFANPQYQFSRFLSDRLSSPPRELAIADYERWQQFSSRFQEYNRLGFSQRQYLVADASRFFYEMRLRYEQNREPVWEFQGPLVLVDFGAAKSVTATALLKTGTTIGSPAYIAPEQARGKAVFASDLYSLGVTCIHLLTGVSPLDLFDPDHDRWVWRRYLKLPISEKLGNVLDRLLEAGLHQRYQSATEVLRDLQVQPAPRLGQPEAAPPSPTQRLSVAANPAPEKIARDRQSQKPARTRTPLRSQSPTWQCRYRLENTGKLTAIALSPVASILASSSGTAIRLWDLETGQAIRTLTGHLDFVSCLAITPDGSLLISGAADKSLRLWNVQTGQRLGAILLHTDTVLSLAVSPDGQFLASASRQDPIALLHLATRQEQHQFIGHAGWIHALTFSPDGKLLASGSGDGSIRLWDWQTGTELRTPKGQPAAIATLAFSPDSKTLVSGRGDGTVNLWSMQTYRVKRSLEVISQRVNSLVFSPDGKFLATGSDAVKLWNPRNGEELLTLGGHEAEVVAIATGRIPNPLGKKPLPILVSASGDGTIQFWHQLPAE
jgi:serine/threonine protein kinase